jgi:glycine hydroxymethyltransferase
MCLMTSITSKLSEADNEIYEVTKLESKRQEDCIELIASENFTSLAVMEAQSSSLTNKYAEGYPGKRYYSGCQEVDKVETIAIERAKKLFHCNYANVQPHSGSQANQAVFLALLQPKDTILGMSLDSGGHLTHGASPNLSGKWFNPVFYGVDPVTHLIDYNKVEELAVLHKPRLIIAGCSAYSRQLDFATFRRIADKVGAYLLADMAHIAGLVATGEHPSPLPYAHCVTSTTHKTLRGPRGGLILSNDEELGKKLNLAVFPGLQGGPLMHIIAAKAVAFGEALKPEYKDYIKQVVVNAKILAKVIQSRGYEVVTNGTDNHMLLVDLRKSNISGKVASHSLEKAGITCNKNAVPFDNASPFITSGIRLGSPACTTRGFKEVEFDLVGNLIADLLDGFKISEDNSSVEQDVFNQVIQLTRKFPIYTISQN